MNRSIQDNRKSLVIGSRAENFVSKSILLEEAEPPRIIRMTVWLTVGVLIGFLVWSFFAQLDVVAVAKGVVVLRQTVREALLFGAQHQLLALDGRRIAAGESQAKKIKTYLSASSTEVRDCMRQALFVGRWLCKAGSSPTVLALLGVQA